jgi:hypothetical protein
MHGVSSTAVADTFTVNGVGATILVKGNQANLFPSIKDCNSTFTSTAVTGSAVLSFDVMMKDGIFIDSGIPAVSVAGTITGMIHGTCNSGIIQAVRHRITGMTGGTCVVTNKLVNIL